MKLGFRQGLVSAAIFGAVLFTLISVDDRVRDRFGDLVSAREQPLAVGDCAGDLGVLVSAVRVSVAGERSAPRFRRGWRPPCGLHAEDVSGG